MNYNSDHYYRIANGIIIIILIPFFILIYETKENNYIQPSIILFNALIIGLEYSYIFPRQAMKLYEKILFKSYIEKNSIIIEIILFISFSAMEAYYFITGTSGPVLTSIIAYLVWYFIFQRQSIVVGDKNIIIGRKLISHDLIQSISIKKKEILIEVEGQSFKINNMINKNQKNKLELVLKQIVDKIKD